jgi:DNA-binding NarL/FixJ family response regulator
LTASCRLSERAFRKEKGSIWISENKKNGATESGFSGVCTMPNMQGVDLVRWLHQHFPALSVLMVSGFGNIDLMNNVIRPDIDASLKKPVLPVQIMLTIAMLDRLNNVV